MNGSFEDGAYSDFGTGSTFVFEGDSGCITGWSVYNGDLDWFNTPNHRGVPTSHGSKFVSLYVQSAAPPYSGVQQTVATPVGQRYSFALDLGSNRGNPEVDWASSFSVTAGSASASFTLLPSSATPEWQRYGFSFSAA